MELNDKLDQWFSRVQVFALLTEPPHPLDGVIPGLHAKSREEFRKPVVTTLLQHWCPVVPI